MDSGATACGTVSVPAHEAVDVRVTGTDCAPVQAVVMGAVGRGRAAYEVDDYACTPADAPDGDTFYDCVADGAQITFRYGAVSS